MKVDELIEKLQKARSKSGNIEVSIAVDDDMGWLWITEHFDVYETHDAKGNPYISLEADYLQNK